MLFKSYEPRKPLFLSGHEADLLIQAANNRRERWLLKGLQDPFTSTERLAIHKKPYRTPTQVEYMPFQLGEIATILEEFVSEEDATNRRDHRVARKLALGVRHEVNIQTAVQNEIIGAFALELESLTVLPPHLDARS